MRTFLLLALSACMIVCNSQAFDHSVDRAFYQEIDRNDWPGNDLSEKQVLRAIHHFQGIRECTDPHRWALIGPNTFLFEGSDYLVHRRLDAEVPNVGWSKGYWGGTPLYDPIPPVDSVMGMVDRMYADDCKYGKR